MRRFLILALSLLLSAQAYSQTCSEQFASLKKKHFMSKISADAQQAITVTTGFSGIIIGVAVAGSTIPAFLIASAIFTAPITVGHAVKGIQNRPLNRMIRLIKQSDDLVANPNQKAGGLLRRVHKRLGQSKLNNISILELASAISAANKDLTKCGSIYGVKNIDENVADGKLPIIDLDPETSAQ